MNLQEYFSCNSSNTRSIPILDSNDKNKVLNKPLKVWSILFQPRRQELSLLPLEPVSHFSKFKFIWSHKIITQAWYLFPTKNLRYSELTHFSGFLLTSLTQATQMKSITLNGKSLTSTETLNTSVWSRNPSPRPVEMAFCLSKRRNFEPMNLLKGSHVFFRQFRIFTANSNSKRMPFFEYGLRMNRKSYFSENWNPDNFPYVFRIFLNFSFLFEK